MQFDLLLQNLKSGTKYLDLQDRMNANSASFTYYPPFWRLFGYKLRSINFNWQHLDYKSDENPNVAPKTPGIYLFVMKPPLSIFSEYSHVMYVGMSDEGLNERLNNGYRMPSVVKLRPNIHRLILNYGKYLVWYYLPLDGFNKTQLKEIETLLIGYFCDPPINKKDQPIQIRQANKSKMF